MFVWSVNAQNTNRVEAANSSCYGMTASGGHKGYGVVYHYRGGSNSDSVLVNLNGNGNGLGDPWGSVIQATNGRLYGMTYYGGTHNDGAVYSYNITTGTDSIVISFDSINGQYPYGNLLQASNGLMYGMTEAGGKYGYGVLFRFNPVTFQDTVLFDFNIANGAEPRGNLIQATDGKIYGMTYTGGTIGYGVIFRLDPVTNKDTVLYNFQTTDGYGIYGSLYQASNGLMYGMSEYGGTHDLGVLFSFDPITMNENVLVSFDSLNGKGPYGNVIQATDGKLYGMTFYGGTSDGGVLYSYDIAKAKDSVVYNFTAASGEYPLGTPMQAPNGKLYGLTGYGGSGYGVIYQFDPKTGVDSVLVKFNSTTTGAYGPGDVILASNGEYYGMTYLGGLYNSGTLFKYNFKTGADSVLINMGTGGSNNGVIMEASNGMLYGMTELGGTDNQGELFMYNPITGADTVLVNFNDTTNGSYPYAGVRQAKDGLLYGLTSAGGTYNYGTIFSLDPVTDKYTQLYSFNDTNGAKPLGQLTQAPNGKLYGMTWLGGSNDYGVLFSYDPKTGKDTVWVNYNGANGQFGFLATLMNGPGGYMYGQTYEGGGYGDGELFRFDPNTGKDTILHSFDFSDGNAPQGVVVVDTPSHTLYGTASGGGTGSNGVLYSYNLNTNVFSIPVMFNGANGSTPTGFLMQDSSTGLIYGTTYNGGAYNFGTLFTYDPKTGKDSIVVSFNDTNGASPVSIIIAKNIPLGVNNVKQEKQTVIVYPNPVTDAATVVFDKNGRHYIEMDDVTGKKVKWIATDDMQCHISRDDLPAGAYFLRFFDGNQKMISTAKIIVQ